MRRFYPEYIGVLIQLANQSRTPVISLDIPSGVECDTGAVHGPCIQADCTVTFTVPKVGHILYPGREYCGQVVPVAAGIFWRGTGVQLVFLSRECFSPICWEICQNCFWKMHNKERAGSGSLHGPLFLKNGF